MLKILADAEVCVGCRVCEIVCSFHHNGAFSPDASSIKVSRDNQNGDIEVYIDSNCDSCVEEAGPLCVEYCLLGALKGEENNEHK